MSRADEIAQGLRHEGGALTFPLDAIDYQQGYVDFTEGAPPPRMTSDSYDLGRAYGQRKQEEEQRAREILAQIEADRAAGNERVRAMLADHPDVLAEFDAKIAALKDPRPR